jgi:hypothetical protein
VKLVFCPQKVEESIFKRIPQEQDLRLQRFEYEVRSMPSEKCGFMMSFCLSPDENLQ